MFSDRTSWQRRPNKLALLVEDLRHRGRTYIDLTQSNPTSCGIAYPVEEILDSFRQDRILRYDPNPRGLLSAREAVAAYYRERLREVNVEDIFLTSSTSEAYSMLLQLLCEPGDDIAVPLPSYPLFDYIARINDVRLRHYHLTFDGRWHVDVDSLHAALTPSTKAIVLINPHNPCGNFVKHEELRTIVSIAHRHRAALIVDEVFLDYPMYDDDHRYGSTAGESAVLTFTLNGISKTIGLPQMKLGWVVVSGPAAEMSEACERFEIISDTFLSTNTPVQVALPALMRTGNSVRDHIRTRVHTNAAMLTERLGHGSSCSVLPAEGGWSAVLRVPRTRTDEEWAVRLLESSGVLVHPGYFFDFHEEGFLVASLLPDTQSFGAATSVLAETFRGP